MFTGHLLQALDGGAATADGVLTANGVMSYVYERVGKDHLSQQTPHYGFLEGDGDFIFCAPILKELTDEATVEKDVLVSTSAAAPSDPQPGAEAESLTDTVKELLSDPRHRIKLDDYVTAQIRYTLQTTAHSQFPADSPVTPETIGDRLKRYEAGVIELQKTAALLAKWGDDSQRGSLEKIINRVGEIDTTGSGVDAWLRLRSYPISLIIYATGIAALSDNNYQNLAASLLTKVSNPRSIGDTHEVIIPAVDGLLDVGFGSLPAHKNNYVPHSEYLYKALQPMLEDLFFLGSGYEKLFDLFEIFLALVFADLQFETRREVWGPPGRFAWKYRSRLRRSNPFSDLIAEAAASGNSWPPLKAGFFQRSYDRFTQITAGYETFMKSFGWH